MKAAAMLVVLIGISGYAFIGTTGYAFAETQDKYSQCMERLKTDSRLSSIANHVSLDAQGTVSRQMLADKARADDLQKQAIAEWIDARAQCVNFGAGPVSINLHMVFVSIVAELYNGQMTFGEFNKKWQELYKKESKLKVPK